MEVIGIVFDYVFTPIYNLFFYVFYGFLLLSAYVYEIIRYAIKGLLVPFLITNGFFDNMSKKAKEKEKIRLLKEEKEEELRIQREKRAEQERLAALQRQKENAKRILQAAKEERELLRQEDSDLYSLDSGPRRKTFGDKLNDILTDLNKSIGKYISRLNKMTTINKKKKVVIDKASLVLDVNGEDGIKSEKKVLYHYTGKNAEGDFEEGYHEAFSKVEVHSFLLAEGMNVFSIEAAKSWGKILHYGEMTSNVRFKLKDLIFFVTQLSTYLKAGIPLVDAIKILEKQYKNKGYKKVFRSMIYSLSMGDSFSNALLKQGEAFPKLLINMVKTAEMTGELPEVLDDQEHYYSELNKTRAAMKSALTYPIIVLLFALGVMTFIMVSVIPHFVSIFESMDAAKIPEMTLAIMALSNFLRKSGLLVALGIIIFVFILVYFYKNVTILRGGMQEIAMHLPVMGNLIVYNEVTVFTKTFASLLMHNVFITDSMEILMRVTNNEVYKSLIKETINNLAKGEKVSTAFKDHWAFPQAAYEMIVTGERTGELPNMMGKVSEYYQNLHQNQVNQFKALLEPILIVFLTIIVGIIVLSIVIPMFSMYNSLEGMA